MNKKITLLIILLISSCIPAPQTPSSLITDVNSDITQNNAPSVVLGNNITIKLPTNYVLINSSSNDVDGSITSFRWEKITGLAATMENTNQADLQVSNLASGEHVFKITVTDNMGATASDEIIVNVLPADIVNRAPVIGNVNAITIKENEEKTINIQSSDADNDKITLTLNFANSLSDIIDFQDNGNGTAQLSIKPQAGDRGTYTLALNATDGALSSSQNISLTIEAALSEDTHRDVACLTKAQGGLCDEIYPKNNEVALWINNRHLPGKTICIKSGSYTGLVLDKLTGEINKPVTITNCGGRVVFDADIQNWQVAISGDGARFIRLTGTGDSTLKYGIEQKNANIHGINFDRGATDIEIDHLEVHNNGCVGIAIRSYPRCDGLHHRGNFVQKNTLVHDNYIHDSLSCEGLYLGTSHYQENKQKAYVDDAACAAKLYLEPALHDTKVYNNIVEDTGNDGIQVGAGTHGTEIYNNTIRRYARTQNPGHLGGIQINPGTVGKVYGNWIESISNDTYGTAIQYAGGSDGDIEIYNNLILNSKTPFLTLGHMITPNFATIFRNNTIINNGGISLYLFCTHSPYLSSTTPHPMTIQNNIFVGYNTVGSYVWTDNQGAIWTKIFDGTPERCRINGKSYPNNLDQNQKIPGNFYSKNINDAGFENTANSDFSLISNAPATGHGALVLPIPHNAD